jgi:DNA-directed RNA polymerase specialized sigma24 family protein
MVAPSSTTMGGNGTRREDASERLQKALAELNKAGVRTKLVKYASWRAHAPQDAEDLVQSALAKVFDPQDCPWDPSGSATFFRHVGSVINGLAANAGRSATARHEVIDSNIARDRKTIDGAPLADEALGEQRELAVFRRLGGELLVELEKEDPEGARVYRALGEGVESPAELAAKADVSLDTLRFVRERVRYRGRKLLAREEEGERLRMAALRQGVPTSPRKGPLQ